MLDGGLWRKEEIIICPDSALLHRNFSFFIPEQLNISS
jgi:hypothetical protein